jgi:antitoxin component YwqK of YwqJK toxin-antitoxin module
MKYSLIISFLLTLCSCSNEPTVLLTRDRTDPAFSLHGDTLYYLQTKYSGYLLDRNANGDSVYFAVYLNGLQHGIQKSWYTNKALSEIRFFDRGVKTGIHKGYWEDGRPRFEYEFQGGEHHGTLKEWYKNGQAYKCFHYDKGYEEGSQKMWWENGGIRANYVVKNGRRYGLIGLKLCVNPENTVSK